MYGNVELCHCEIIGYSKLTLNATSKTKHYTCIHLHIVPIFQYVWFVCLNNILIEYFIDESRFYVSLTVLAKPEVNMSVTSHQPMVLIYLSHFRVH